MRIVSEGMVLHLSILRIMRSSGTEKEILRPRLVLLQWSLGKKYNMQSLILASTCWFSTNTDFILILCSVLNVALKICRIIKYGMEPCGGSSCL